jgi:hypothetical protein
MASPSGQRAAFKRSIPTSTKSVMTMIGQAEIWRLRMTKSEHDVIKWYVEKFKTKLTGVSYSTAKGWVKGIGTAATESEKDEILKRIAPCIDYSRR